MDQSLQKLERVGGSLVLLVVVLVFAPSLFGDYVWDDHSLIVDNANVRDPASLYELVSTPFWAELISTDTAMSPLYTWLHRPLIKVVYHFGLKLGDDSPFAFHLILLALHVACTFLVFDLIRAWLGERTSATTLTALVLATIFAIHPTRAENVAWISGITDVAMTLFTLVGLGLLRGPPTLGRLIGGGCAIALAGWSKETAVLAPALVLAQCLAMGDPRPSILRKVLAATAGAVAVTLSFVLVVSSTAERMPIASEENVVRRVLATIGWFGARVIWPVPATIFPGAFVRGPNGVLPSARWAVVAGAGILGAGAGLTAWVARRQSPPKMLFPLAVFFVPLLLVANLVQRSDAALIADRFLYLPLLGPLLLLAGPGARLFVDASRGRAIGLLLAGAFVLPAASETLDSSARFVDNLALFEHEVRVQPDFHESQQILIAAFRFLERFGEARDVALTALARAHQRRDGEGEIRFALEYTNASVQFFPELDQESLGRIRGVYSRLVEDGRIAIDDSRLRFSRSLDPMTAARLRSDAMVFRIPRAVVHMRTGDLPGAQAQLEALVRESPRIPLAWELLAICRARRGDLVGAERAIDVGVSFLGEHRKLVEVRQMLTLVEQLEARTFADPSMTTVRDANLQLILGSPGAARTLLMPVVGTHPNFIEASVLLAQAEEADGLPRRAEQVLENALMASPQNEILRASLTALRSRIAADGATAAAPSAEP